MTDAILSDNQRKAELSHAFVAALAAKAGYTVQRGPEPDMDSIGESGLAPLFTHLREAAS